MRTGVITKKLEKNSFFDEEGNRVPVTLLQLDQCSVVDHKNMEKHGYEAVVIGSGVRKDKHLTKPMKGVYEKLKTTPKRTNH